MVWRASTRSGNSGNCVEVAYLNGHRAVRDSKNPTGAILILSASEWCTFTAGVCDGQFD
ncbi:MAG: DUF397 domain-containing protein [Pseudonocardiaceae bacterium]